MAEKAIGGGVALGNRPQQNRKCLPSSGAQSRNWPVVFCVVSFFGQFPYKLANHFFYINDKANILPPFKQNKITPQ
jgi:hypothetical protein